MRRARYSASRKQTGGIFRGTRKQLGGFAPLLIPPLILAGLKAAGTAAALGAAGAAGHHAVDAIAGKLRGGGKRRKRKKRKNGFRR